LAFPWGKDQPTEIWLAARIRFLIKVRKRIWDQTGIKNLVNVTAPKRIAHVYTDGLSNKQVKNRMGALATMIDSRGWAVKSYLPEDQQEESDRLASGTVRERTAMKAIVNSTPDILEDQGVISKQFDSMIQKSEQVHKAKEQQIISNARKISTNTPAQTNKNNPDFWFMNQAQQPLDPSLTTFQSSPVITPGSKSATNTTATNTTAVEEQNFIDQVNKKHTIDDLQTKSTNEKVITPLDESPKTTPVENKSSKSTMTPPKDPDILELAKSNDLNIATLERQGKKDLSGSGEVVVSLH